MSALPPTNDDSAIWDCWLAQFRLPIVNTAIEVGTFEALSNQPLTTEELAAELGVDARALAMHLAALCPQGFVEKRLGKWRATHLARTWLHPEATGFWGPFLGQIDRNEPLRGRLMESLRTGKRPEQGTDQRPAGWEKGTMPQEVAANIAAFMQAHSQAPALGAARMPVFGELSHLMDIGCGSGVYGIEIAKANPALKVTLMDLKEVAFEAAKYVEAANIGARVSTTAVNMFEQEWPRGADGHFFSNVFHDWTEETNITLARKSFAALPSGGRIFLNEILMDDDYTGPYQAAAFSLLMLIGTLGKQYSLAELREILEEAGFVDVEAQRTGGGYYSLVSARKP
ncbi:methyltransferase [Altererythrobacter sp. CC-YST694]|uniref:acetylserotonin O-methyltransferase n=1 Tax=Altererythrobacter sp. CC-YST694 TaxID=2755038 RepID=UPI001D02F09D|nr:acetylserotonin O-methyltransferase [Altererythrobacter sp. CC-YST694]MCB5424291.1 methyltransferase [Altererythrobacter sp. CC-YST694]